MIRIKGPANFRAFFLLLVQAVITLQRSMKSSVVSALALLLFGVILATI
jgi:hypothetical protein